MDNRLMVLQYESGAKMSQSACMMGTKGRDHRLDT